MLRFDVSMYMRRSDQSKQEFESRRPGVTDVAEVVSNIELVVIVGILLQHPAFVCCSDFAWWQMRWQIGLQVAHLHSHT